MHLYPVSMGSRPGFHCFGCGKHGDVYDLVKQLLDVDFSAALRWLADKYRIEIPSSKSTARDTRQAARDRGLELGFNIYKRQSRNEEAELLEWSKERHFESTFLTTEEVVAAFPQKISVSFEATQREQFDELESAGLIIRPTPPRRDSTSTLPMEIPPRDFYGTARILFAIRDDRGRLSGFAGRATGNDLPKYLFTPGFPRGGTLYHFDRVRRSRRNRVTSKANDIHVYLVEGLLDALRLETFGLNAVALLGNQITTKQIELLVEYAKELDRDDHRLVVHIFLDADAAGRRGAISATAKLLDAAAETLGLLFDVIIPSKSTDFDWEHEGHDPDAIFSRVDDRKTVTKLLAAWSNSPLSVLLAAGLEIGPEELDSVWDSLRETQRLQAFRDVERRFDQSKWVAIFDRVPVFESHLGTSGKPADWQERVRRFVCGERARRSVLLDRPPEKGGESRLVRAIQIAEASTQRREFPIDVGSWERLLSCVDVIIPQLQESLKDPHEARQFQEKFLSVLVPKPDGRLRFKALPQPETLSLQQYVLNELLRDYFDCPRFRQLVPAVRFTSGPSGPLLETTGPEHLIPINRETVSFAYTVDMDVIEHRAQPNAGMFRPYFDCWQNFIRFIDSRISAFPHGRFHVARLDIKSLIR